MIRLIRYFKLKLLKLFRYFGYDINRIPRLYKDKINPTQGLIIEIVGPSGVGKTTLFNKLFKDYEKDWYTRDQLLVRAEPPKYFYNMKSEYLESLYSNILIDKINSVFSDEDSLAKKYRLTEYFMKELSLDAAAKTSSLNKGLFSDEGLTYNFCKEIIELSHSLDNNNNMNVLKKGMESFFKSRLIITVKASPEFIIYNLKKRNIEQAEEGEVDSLNDFYNIIGENRLEEYLESVFDNIEKMEIIAEKYGASVLTIDVEKENQIEIYEKVLKYTKEQMTKDSLIR